MSSRLQDVILRDTRVNQPAASAVAPGTIYFVTDELVTERSNGTSWENYSDTGTVVIRGIQGVAGLIGPEPEEPEIPLIIPATPINTFTGDAGAGGVKGLVPAPAIGDATKFLRGDASWQAVSAISGVVLVAETSLNTAAINALNTTPYVLVATPGANKIVVPIWMIFWFTQTGNAFSGNPSFRIRWNGLTADIITAFNTFNLTVANNGNFFVVKQPLIISSSYGGNDWTNKALELSASADTTGGAGSTLRVSMAYYIAGF